MGDRGTKLSVRSLCLSLIGLLVQSSIAGSVRNVTSPVNECQVRRPLRKQIEAEPLAGMCLKDIVVRFSNALRSIATEELGSTAFQEMVDRLDAAKSTDSPDNALRNLVDAVNAKLNSYDRLLEHCDEAVRDLLLDEHYSSYYADENVRGTHLTGDFVDICSRIEEALIAKVKNVRWKDLRVLPVRYPGLMCGPASSTHNVGSLLLSQCDKPKNVLLLLEHGTFMSEGDFALAQVTAKTIIDMLSELDRVTVVGLTGRGHIHCRESLMSANDINKFQLARHVDSLSRNDANETLDIDFRALTANLVGDVVTIHLTNTLEDVSDVKNIVNTIANERLTPHLRTVLILSDLKPHINIRETSSNGSVITLPTENVLGYELARLFSVLQCPSENKKSRYLSDPSLEHYGKSMTVSVGRITNTALLSLDVKLRDFLEDFTYFNGGPRAYAFLFDRKGIVWMHKYFPRVETLPEQPLKVHLRDIENVDVDRMINETEGILEARSQGGLKRQYRWTHLAYPDLIACVVSEESEEPRLRSRTAPRLPSDILHHRLDLIQPHSIIGKDELCSYQNNIATLATGVVYLSPWCFKSPTEQFELLETGSVMTVQSYMAYIKDTTRLLTNPGLRSSVRSDVATLAQILDHFKERHVDSPFHKFIVRRYAVSSESGALVVYPGMVLDSGLDPLRRAWYVKSLEHPGNVILTPPYLDAGGAGYVVSLSQTIHEGRSVSQHSSDDPVYATMSMDLPMSYLARLLREMFPLCNDSTIKCFLMDDKGWLVSHVALLEPGSKLEQPQHLTHKELLVANDILNHEFFVKKKVCANHLDGTLQRYYQFNTSLDEVLTNIVHGEHCVKYQVAAVPGTNVFLGIINETCSLRAFCPCSTMDRLCLNCKRMEQTECECPCECSLYNVGCSQPNTSHLETCAPPYEQGFSSMADWSQLAALKPCPVLNCKNYETVTECMGIVGCQWCSIDSDGESLLQRPFCSDMNLCFKGVLGSFVPYADGSYNSQSTDENVSREWPSVGPVAGGILAIVLILGITLFCYRLRSVQSGLEHQCLHVHASPDNLRMTHLDADNEPLELEQSKNNLDTLLPESVAPISPYRVSTNYRRPPGGDSDHGYSTMTPHDDSEQQTFAEPLLVVGVNSEPEVGRRNGPQICSPTTQFGSPHHVLAPVTVHRDMEPSFC